MKKRIFLSFSFCALLLAGCTTNQTLSQISETKPSAAQVQTQPTLPALPGVPAQSLADGDYTLSVDKSTFFWHGEKIVGAEENGTITPLSGNMTVENGSIVSGNFEMDMNTIASVNKEGKKNMGLEKHLKSADFFDAVTFPKSSFMVTKMENIGNGLFRISGNLTIKDKTNPVTIASVQMNNDNGVLYTQGKFSVDRTLWDVRYGSGKFFQGLGDKVIKDNMDFAFQFSFEKK